MHKQDGFVSIITTSVIMIIVTLIVVGFSLVMSREQRQALDRQLNSQALYAAETGVNDLYDKLQKGELTEEEKKTCNVSDWPNAGVVNPGSSNEAAYTCLEYDQTPTQIDFNNGSITTQQSKIISIEPKSNGGGVAPKMKSLTFSWSGARGNTDMTLPKACAADFDVLPRTTATQGVPILRIDLIKASKIGPINASQLLDYSTHFYLYPKECGNNKSDYSTHINQVDKGKVIPVNCLNTNGYACQYQIDNMQLVNGGSDRYYMRIKSIYNDADVRLEGTSDISPSDPVEFLGAQVSVDVTGKSNDVLKRINVKLGNPNFAVPEFVAQGMNGICKGVKITPPYEAPLDCYR